MLFSGSQEKVKEKSLDLGAVEFDIKTALESEHYHLYKFLGVNTNPQTQETSFRVWAPNVKAVSLIADFNGWSKRTNPMQQIADTGIWTLTIPKRDHAFAYQFAIHQQNDEINIINDPYSKDTINETRFASYFQEDSFTWQDQDWIKRRENSDYKDKAIIIKAIDLDILLDKKTCNFQSLANLILQEAKEEGVTHIELVNAFEAVINLSYSNQFSKSKEAFFLCPSSAYGQSNDFKCFIDFLHQNNLGVIINLPFFANEISSQFGNFKSLQKPIHTNFYLSVISYWLEEMHIDGFNFGPLENVLVKSKGRSRENIKAFNELIHKRSKGVFSVAQETNCFSLLTNINQDSLDFDFKINNVWFKQVQDILKDKSKNLENFATNLLSEKYLLGIIKDFDMQGLSENDFKVFLALSFLLPSKKYFKESTLEAIFNKFPKLVDFYRDLSLLYEKEKILCRTDLLAERFSMNKAHKNVFVFQRWSYDFSELIISVVNFANTSKQSFQIDVAKAGFYQEIFDSSSYSKQTALSNEDGVYSYSNNTSLSKKSIVLDIPAKSVLCYKFSS